MIKKNLKTLIITSLIILIPMFAGLFLWNVLPDTMPMHWNINGEVDGWVSKPVAIFGMPLAMIAFQWLCTFITGTDPKNKNITKKSMDLVLWIIPCITLMLGTITYLAALNYPISVDIIMPAFFGVFFIVVGNYLPKCKQSHTIGIKLPWTLESEDNWNKTHRFAGKLWVICGLLILILSFLGNIYIMMGVTLVMVLIPAIYSYLLYKKSTK